MADGPAITREQIAQYQRDGAILIRGALGAEDVALLERGLEEAHNAPGEQYSVFRNRGAETLVDQFPSAHCPSLRSLIDKGPFAGIAGRLMQAPSAQLILEQIFYKAAGPINPTSWHQDTSFLRLRGDDMARVWISCDPSPSALTVQVARGSHRWNVVYNTNIEVAASELPSSLEEGGGFTYAGIGDVRAPPLPDVIRYRDSFDILKWDVEPGDAVVFNGNMLHGADGAEHHPAPRRALATTWGGPDLRYIHPEGNAMPSPAEITGIAVPDGARIGDHEAAFAVGWRR